ncbi:MAG: hypothetical protein ABIP55_02970, partial [Tepidisphaeraceae bacterium]
MHHLGSLIVVAALSCIAFSPALRAVEAPAAPVAPAPTEKVDNPQFTNWSKFNVGSSSTLDTEINAQGQKIATESTNKLLEKNADNVVI